MTYIKLFSLSFFVINAIFWGLFPHKQHCALAMATGTMSVCPPHYIHIIIGIVSFLISVCIAQYDYIFKETIF